MFIGRPPGNYDRLLDFSRAVTGNLFFVPSATFLENVTDDETNTDQPVTDQPVNAEPSASPAYLSIHSIGARWFARHRFPQRRHQHE